MTLGTHLNWVDLSIEANFINHERKLSMKKFVLSFVILLFAGGLMACSPEVGSKEWCEDLKEKDKGQWTATEAKDFAKHCIL